MIYVYIYLARIFFVIVFFGVLIVALSALYAEGLKPLVRGLRFRLRISKLSRRGALTPERLREAAERFHIAESKLPKYGKLLNTYRNA
ncbi:MAG: hypothetical protein ACREQX_00025 [Candidatus Binataceae bacterium]